MLIFGILGMAVGLLFAIPAVIIKHKTDNYEWDQIVGRFSEVQQRFRGTATNKNITMTTIEDILKPKSKDDLTEEISRMTSFEYLYAFEKHSRKELRNQGIKIGFKKLFYEFIMDKRILKTYGIYILIWFMLIIFGLITKNSFETIGKIENLLAMLLYIFWLPLMTAQFFAKRRYSKFLKKILDEKYRVERNQMINRFENNLAAQEMIDQVFGMLVPFDGAIQASLDAQPNEPQNDEDREHTETEE